MCIFTHVYAPWLKLCVRRSSHLQALFRSIWLSPVRKCYAHKKGKYELWPLFIHISIYTNTSIHTHTHLNKYKYRYIWHMYQHQHMHKNPANLFRGSIFTYCRPPHSPKHLLTRCSTLVASATTIVSSKLLPRPAVPNSTFPSTLRETGCVQPILKTARSGKDPIEHSWKVNHAKKKQFLPTMSTITTMPINSPKKRTKKLVDFPHPGVPAS